jgi:ketosteroid isomerase-like protein
MKQVKVITMTLLMGLFFTASFGQGKAKKNEIQSFQEHSPTKHHAVAIEVINASKAWIEAFNKGNAEACVKGYDSKATMSAMPFGVKSGIDEISGFWTPFIKSGATNLIYNDLSIEVANETTVFLSANWSMNVGRGKIYQEKWEKKDGRWVLTYDNFQVLEQFDSPKENTTNPVASHIILEEIIKASMEWTNGFNSGNSTICGNGYSKDATMNAMPFASLNGKSNIEGFWKKLIADGAKNLTYHNPTFAVKTDVCAVLSSQWSMNIGEGKIYQEKWEKVDGKWLLTYDEFKVLAQY